MAAAAATDATNAPPQRGILFLDSDGVVSVPGRPSLQCPSRVAVTYVNAGAVAAIWRGAEGQADAQGDAQGDVGLSAIAFKVFTGGSREREAKREVTRYNEIRGKVDSRYGGDWSGVPFLRSFCTKVLHGRLEVNGASQECCIVAMEYLDESFYPIEKHHYVFNLPQITGGLSDLRTPQERIAAYRGCTHIVAAQLLSVDAYAEAIKMGYGPCDQASTHQSYSKATLDRIVYNRPRAEPGARSVAVFLDVGNVLRIASGGTANHSASSSASARTPPPSLDGRKPVFVPRSPTGAHDNTPAGKAFEESPEVSVLGATLGTLKRVLEEAGGSAEAVQQLADRHNGLKATLIHADDGQGVWLEAEAIAVFNIAVSILEVLLDSESPWQWWKRQLKEKDEALQTLGLPDGLRPDGKAGLSEDQRRLFLSKYMLLRWDEALNTMCDAQGRPRKELGGEAVLTVEDCECGKGWEWLPLMERRLASLARRGLSESWRARGTLSDMRQGLQELLELLRHNSVDVAVFLATPWVLPQEFPGFAEPPDASQESAAPLAPSAPAAAHAPSGGGCWDDSMLAPPAVDDAVPSHAHMPTMSFPFPITNGAAEADQQQVASPWAFPSHRLDAASEASAAVGAGQLSGGVGVGDQHWLAGDMYGVEWGPSSFGVGADDGDVAAPPCAQAAPMLAFPGAPVADGASFSADGQEAVEGSPAAPIMSPIDATFSDMAPPLAPSAAVGNRSSPLPSNAHPMHLLPAHEAPLPSSGEPAAAAASVRGHPALGGETRGMVDSETSREGGSPDATQGRPHERERIKAVTKRLLTQMVKKDPMRFLQKVAGGSAEAAAAPRGSLFDGIAMPSAPAVGSLSVISAASPPFAGHGTSMLPMVHPPGPPAATMASHRPSSLYGGPRQVNGGGAAAPHVHYPPPSRPPAAPFGPSPPNHPPPPPMLHSPPAGVACRPPLHPQRPGGVPPGHPPQPHGRGTGR
ncbi:unnamed protein product [Vitrella brassicaformis CCMP3155]|uniref:Uncharacterized protein n=1 Tax=Vitrella brassicaformis (strain CCMP3155) TaxID=1169540 RepID=A0A0G4EL02_VITBC|nr:unnamed protein product [Vitrella brassicaformis CCMP3155]|eukprot:CEL97664.1 unnamed protein product [Vitrella brassicaformis CCMP3155]